MARSDWYDNEREAVAEALELAGHTDYMGDCMTVEHVGEERPQLLGVAYATSPKLVDEIHADDEEDEDAGV